MRIKSTSSSSTQPLSTPEAELPESESPAQANVLQPIADGFEAPKAAAKASTAKAKAVTPAEPKLVKVEGETPTYESVNAKLVDGGISPTDVDQGELGDCFFLSSLTSLAEQNPKALQDMVQDNKDGTYTVTFYKKSGSSYAPVKVTVDGKIPELVDDQNKEEPVYAASPDSKELWPSIVEKAYAELKKGYNVLDQGGYEVDAMAALTGKKAESYDVTPESSTALCAMLQQALASGKLVTAGTFTESDLKANLTQLSKKGEATFSPSTTYDKLDLVEGHAYTVLGVKDDGGEPMVQMRNPWGTQGYQGQGKDDGEFEIPLNEFAQLFQEVSVGG